MQFSHWKEKIFLVPELSNEIQLPIGKGDIIIEIDNDNVIAPIQSTQFGVNSNFRSGGNLVSRSEKYQSFGAFRFPAGSGSNRYFYDCEIPSSFLIEFNAICGTSNSALSPEDFIEFKSNADGEATIVINYMYARYGMTSSGSRASKVLQAATYAADFVQFLNIEKDAGIKYWEIGNECYGPWEEGYDVNGSIITGREYGEDFRVFAELMKEVDPEIRLGAVLWHRDEKEWNEQVLPEVENHADFLIVHHYFHVFDFQDAKEALAEIESDMDEIQSKVEKYTSKPYGYFPVAFTEFNVQDYPATNMLNGLFVADVLATMIKSKFFLTSIWVNEWNIDGNHSKGLLAKNDPDQEDYSPRPSYTPFYFYDIYLGDEMVKVSLSEEEELSVHASTFTSGETGMVILNYGREEKKIALKFLNSDSSVRDLYWHTVHAENVNPGNTKFYVNEQSGTTIGGGPKNLSTVEAFSAKLSENNYISLPPFSATYMAIIHGSSETIVNEFSDTICANEPYIFAGNELVFSGTYIDTIEQDNGPDSINVLSLEVLQNDSLYIVEEICDGEVYTLNGAELSESGRYLDTIVNENGCDTYVQVDLSVIENEQVLIEEYICEGEDYEFNGLLLSEPGIYFDTINSGNGCNIYEELILNQYESITTTIDTVLCIGDSLFYNGSLIKEEGQYEIILFSSYGCDSTLIINLKLQSCSTGSLDQKDHQDLKIFPNPAFEAIYISASQKLIEGVDIFNAEGKICDFYAEPPFRWINLASFENGLYFIKIKTLEGHFVSSFLKL